MRLRAMPFCARTSSNMMVPGILCGLIMVCPSARRHFVADVTIHLALLAGFDPNQIRNASRQGGKVRLFSRPPCASLAMPPCPGGHQSPRRLEMAKKGYLVSAYRSIKDPDKLAAYAKLA